MKSTLPRDRVRPAPFLVGFGVLYAVLAGLAEIDAAGLAGVGVLVAVLLAALVVERLLDGVDPRVALRRLGLGRPRARALLVAAGVAVLLQVVFPLVTLLTGATFTLRTDWPVRLLGLIAFHGLAEELVWRGYAFRLLRQGRSFGAAALMTMPLIAATHLPVVLASGVTVGLAAMLVAAVTSLPLAHLFEHGGHTIWAAALVHAGIDSFKLVTIPAEATLVLSLTLTGLSLTVPLLAFVFLTPSHCVSPSPNKEQPCHPPIPTSSSSEPVRPA